MLIATPFTDVSRDCDRDNHRFCDDRDCECGCHDQPEPDDDDCDRR